VWLEGVAPPVNLIRILTDGCGYGSRFLGRRTSSDEKQKFKRRLYGTAAGAGRKLDRGDYSVR